MDMRNGATRAQAAAAVIAAAALILAGGLMPAQAQSSEDWSRMFGPAYASNDYSERQLIKEWEANPEKGFATLSPNNVWPMKSAIIRYTAIVAKGGWRSLPDVKLEQGSSHAAVAILRERLIMSGELNASASGGYDYEVVKAVKRYQATNGLAPTGIVAKITVAVLNVPAASRLKQLKTNLTRLQEYAKTPRKYVVVNIPAAQIEAVEDGVVRTQQEGSKGAFHLLRLRRGRGGRGPAPDPYPQRPRQDKHRGACQEGPSMPQQPLAKLEPRRRG